MGHWEHKWEDYNPVTDKYTYGPSEYVLDSEDYEKEYERRSKDSEIQIINSYIQSVQKGYDYDAISEAEKKIDNARFLNQSEKAQYRRELAYRIKSIREHDLLREEVRNKKNKIKSQEQQEKLNAFKVAKQRYKSLSLFGKIKNFKQRPTTIDYKQYTVEELDNLYRRR